MLVIGSHVSYKKDTGLIGSVNEALSYGANTFMIYTGAPQNTIRFPINLKQKEEAFKIMNDNHIDYQNIIVHAPYIVNLASGDDFAIQFLANELKRVEQLGITKLVLHPGSSVKLSKEEGINNIINGLNKLPKSSVLICLETMAGKGSEIGVNFNELKQIMDGVNYDLGICLDTCHLNDAGYDITNFDQILDEIDNIMGLDKVQCIHINDSKNDVNSHKDRHSNIGFGYLGFDTIIKVIFNERLKNVPKILETPYVPLQDDGDKIYPPYKFEIEMIKAKKFNPNLIEDIRNSYK